MPLSSTARCLVLSATRVAAAAAAAATTAVTTPATAAAATTDATFQAAAAAAAASADLERASAASQPGMGECVVFFKPVRQEGGELYIADLDKADLLCALYNEAKKSKSTEAVIGNWMCPDEYVRNGVMMREYYQSRIEKEVAKLSLTRKEAEQYLALSPYVEYIGPVLIKIDFSGDTIDASMFDRANSETDGNNCSSAYTILKPLGVTKTGATPHNIPGPIKL